MLASATWIECVGEAASGPATIEAVNALKPDLLFLDIQMPGLLGTDVLRHVEHQPAVIFTTAYAQHAVTAFELGALDYLLKPFGQVRLDQALERARLTMGEPAGKPFDRLRQALGDGPVTRLFVRTGGAIVPVAIETVSWLEARGDYVAAHVGPSRHLLHVALGRIEERLDPAKFVRIHRAHIVNLDWVKSFRSVKGRMEAELKDGTLLSVSRNRSAHVRSLVSEMG
jgi:two-component system LytT family response regulator